jgi:hypothetical protein
MKITDKDRQKIIALYGNQMSVTDITKEINRGRDKELQVSRQAVSKILNQFISGEEVTKGSKGNILEYKKVARATYDKAVSLLEQKLDKTSVQDLLKVIEYYERLYHFSEDQSDENITSIEVNVINAGETNEESD